MSSLLNQLDSQSVSRHCVRYRVQPYVVYSKFTRRIPLQFPLFFFFNDPATPEIYPLSLPDALPIGGVPGRGPGEHPASLRRLGARGNPVRIGRAGGGSSPTGADGQRGHPGAGHGCALEELTSSHGPASGLARGGGGHRGSPPCPDIRRRENKGLECGEPPIAPRPRQGTMPSSAQHEQVENAPFSGG